MKKFGIMLAYLACVIAVVIVRGFVLSRLWGWFIVPLGVPSVTVVGAIGVCLTVSFLTYHPQREAKDETSTADRFRRIIGIGIGGPLIMWGICAIIAGFM